MKKDSTKSDIEEYFMIKSTLKLPMKLKIYMSILEACLQSNNDVSPIRGESKAFVTAFSKMNFQEKSHFLCESIKFLAKALSVDITTGNIRRILAESVDDIKNVQTSSEMSSTKLKIPCWVQVKFRLDKYKRQIYYNTPKRSSFILLKNYLARKSKRYKSAIVLDLAVDDDNDKYQAKYTFCFDANVVDSLYEQIQKVIITCRNQVLCQMIENNIQNSLQKKGSYKQSRDNKSLVFLNSKNISKYLNSKDKFLKYLLTGKFDFKQIGKSGINSLKIQQSQKNLKIFKMQCVQAMNVKNLKQQFLKNYKNNNIYITSSEVLESFNQGKYQAVYQKYSLSGRSQQLIYIRQEIVINSKELEQVFLFTKGIQNIMIPNFMEHLIVKTRPINAKESKLLVVCQINFTPLIRVDVVKEFLNQLSVMMNRKMTSAEMETIRFEQKLGVMEQVVEAEQQQFYTVVGDFGKEQIVYNIEETEFLHEQMIASEIQKSQIFTNYQKIKHRLQPLPTQTFDIKKNLMRQHYLFKQWIRHEEGGVICINQTIINQQKKVFKHIITTFGKSILKGGGILNVSLPVNVFKKESHLESIARNFCYAPLFFENVTDKMERIRKAILLGISVGTLGISMDKPFNPILGETLQVWIGGCPMYLQQISHHPPVSSYLFYGRGYRIHGQIQARISFGLNNVKGYSQNPNYIQFDDGTIIQLVYGKMKINGLMFGERTFDFDDKIYIYDKKNSIFGEVNYGPRKWNLIIKNSEPKDLVYGKIYKVTKEYLSKFQSIIPRIYPTKQHIIKQLEQFEGIWTGPVHFGNKQYINFQKQLPCMVVDQSNPLPSNCHYRKDYIRLMENNLQEAQKQKQILQQIQRRDRKLREVNSKML